MSITPEETIKILTAKAECMRRETSGIDIDCNYRNCDECDLCYKQGTTGDQMEALRVAISALQEQDLQQTCNKLATDTIYRQAAIEAINHICPVDTEYDCTLLDRVDVRCVLSDLPSAQPEIIRCKDCKWWSNDDYRECSNPNYDDGYVTPAGFYCGYAERRTDELGDS